MRSTEPSGVGEDGFSFAHGQPRVGKFRKAIAARLALISPVTIAVAVTALAAATLFFALDLVRTFDDLGHRNALVTRLAAAQPLLARQFAAGSYDQTLGETETGPALIGVLQRGAIGYGLALVAGAVAYRRKPLPVPRDEQEHLADLISTIPFGVACWTSDGRLIVCNEQYRARLNLADNQLQPGSHYKASVLRLIAGGHMQLMTESEAHRVLELHRADGSCLMIDERPLAGGRGFVTLLTDVTERRRTDHLLTSIREEQRVLARRYHEEKIKAEAASRSKTAFLAHLSHDIRTPLNHIIGFADLMRHQTYGPLGDERYESYVESIKASGDRLLSFFASILDLAQLESGERSLQAAELDVDSLIAGVTRRFSSQVQRAGLNLSLGRPTGAILSGDRFSLERALGNLVDNAVRFTPSGGRISVAAYAGEDGVVIEVTDTGIGMSPEKVSVLSQPFAFPDASLARDREGAGLGLAITRTIVGLSGGNLVIDSRPGLGTTVAISLPLLAARAQIDRAA
jgi:two-component system, cell cycle sensor histidine kinase PleC